MALLIFVLVFVLEMFFHIQLVLIIRHCFFEFQHYHLIFLLHYLFFCSGYKLLLTMFFLHHLGQLHIHQVLLLFLLALVNQLVIQRSEILATYDEILAGLTDTATLDAGLQRLEMEKDGVLQRITDLIHENATTKMDQGEYNRRYDALETQRIAISEKQKRIKEKLSDKLFRKRKLEAFMSELKSAEQLVSFDEQMFIRTVEQITVFSDKLVFVFKDGTEIPVEE